MNTVRFAALICAALVLALPCLAQANTVDIEHDGFGAVAGATVWGGGLDGAEVFAGVYMLDKSAGTGLGEIWENGLIPGFCIELNEFSPQETKTYDVVAIADVQNGYLGETLGVEKQEYLSELWGRHYDDAWAAGGPYTNQHRSDAEAFAAAVWEIVYEELPASPLDWDVTVNGWTSGNHGFVAGGINTVVANNYLHSLTGAGPKAQLLAVVREGSQDYIVAVPEPATISLLGLSGLFCLIGRRRTAS